jgi:hypothetical protein
MARFPEVRLFRSDVNRHYALSNNRAIEHAREQYLYLLNNDTIVLPRALDRSPGFGRARRTHRQARSQNGRQVVPEPIRIIRLASLVLAPSSPRAGNPTVDCRVHR